MIDFDTQTDEDLMTLIASGNHQAFATLTRRHTDRYFRLAFRLCKNVQTAEDIVQDSFIKLWKRREKWDPTRGAKFTTWFYRVVYNGTLDFLRKKKPESGVDYLDTFADTRGSQEQDMQNAQEQSEIERAIDTLPERQKTALNLCFYEDVSNKDAAAIMDVGVKALESLLMRAKKSLKEKLIKDEDGIREKKYG